MTSAISSTQKSRVKGGQTEASAGYAVPGPGRPLQKRGVSRLQQVYRDKGPKALCRVKRVPYESSGREGLSGYGDGKQESFSLGPPRQPITFPSPAIAKERHPCGQQTKKSKSLRRKPSIPAGSRGRLVRESSPSGSSRCKKWLKP